MSSNTGNLVISRYRDMDQEIHLKDFRMVASREGKLGEEMKMTRDLLFVLKFLIVI